ncbi:response regulator [Mucilaginibacter celer]|uniref:Response regulator n=1 Tax=Mucilaginibacter celer TaxID=2305508 RepID=A0A494VWT3_9SPHI|nr:response regulator [Mucilaginibacter celer]AYL95768.1 response regulator [Mucilaginibacter celer]
MNQENAGVLYIDDAVSRLDDFKNLFGKSLNVFTAQSVVIARSILAQHEVGVMMISQLMPGTGGLSFFESTAQSYPRVIRILLTGFPGEEGVFEAMNNGLIYACLPKPWQNQNIKQVLKNALEVYYLRKHNIELTYKLYEATYELTKVHK